MGRGSVEDSKQPWRETLNLFRGLGWKLTLSYTLVTVAALLVVEITILVAGLIFVQHSDVLPRVGSRVIAASAVQLAPYLDETPPDINGIESWLLDAAANGFRVTTEQGGTIEYTPGPFSGTDALQVLDKGLNLLARFPPGDSSSLGKPLDFAGTPGLAEIVGLASNGIGDYTLLYRLTPQNLLLVAAPIQDQEHRTLGVLVYTGAFSRPRETLVQALPLVGISALIFTLAAGLVGAIFGALTSRGLARRLRRVSQAADAWSHGDFSAGIQDRSGDELGRLARRLNLMAGQLENLLQARQELATLEERNRLARELHDSVKQQIFAAVMQVGAARELAARDSSAAQAHLGEAERLGRQAQEELAALIRQLRPAALEGKGLVKALQETLEDWSRQSGIAAGLRLQGERPLPLAVEQALYRVAQEALSNVARHSQASAVDVHLGWAADAINLSISDNGQGFNPALANGKPHSGVGLHSMRERVEALGGRLEIQSEVGQPGTHLMATLPLQVQPSQPSKYRAGS
jgi:NarL family two-component system sensor histidine kinase LiaS